MKKMFKVITLCFMIVMLTGCMDFKAEMEIKRDKSMTFSITELVDKEIVKDEVPYFSDSEVKKYRESGFTTSNYVVDDLVGHQLTKKFSNIDKVSSEKQLSSIEATKALLTLEQPIFTVKKGIFKNKYYATFNISEFVKNINIDKTKINNARVEFSLKLPYKAVENNASSVKNSGKELVWDLSKLNTDQIYFEFNLYNLNTIYVVVGIIGVLGILSFFEYRDKKIAKSFYKRK